MNKATDIIDVKNMPEDMIRAAVKTIIDTHAGRGAVNVIKAAYNEGLAGYITDRTGFLDALGWANFSTRCYAFASGMTSLDDLPRCLTCGRLIPKNVVSVHAGFKYATCSRKCAANENGRNERRERTMVDRYGDVDYNNREKYAETCMARFGVPCNMQSEDSKAKSEATKLRRYGDAHYTNHSKGTATRVEKYGMGNNGKAISEGKRRMSELDPGYYAGITEKSKNTRSERYGDANYNNLDRQYATKTSRYGSATYNNRDKAAETSLGRYGVDNPAKTQAAKDAAKSTCMDRYGVDNHAKLDSTKEKAAATSLARYGAEHYAKTEYSRLKTSVRKSSECFNAIAGSSSNRSAPLFSFHDFRRRSEDTMLKWRCLDCGTEFEAPVNFIYARETGTYARCPACHPAPAGGSLEQQLVEEFVRSAYGGEVLSNDRSAIRPLEIDVYVPGLGLGIEFDGLYWHSALWKSDLRHMAKKSAKCAEAGITLVHVLEDEWKNFRRQTEWRLRQIVEGHVKSGMPPDAEFRRLDETTFAQFMRVNSNDAYARYGHRKYGMYSGGRMLFAASVTASGGKATIWTTQCAVGTDIPEATGAFARFVQAEYAGHDVYARLDNRYPYDVPLLNAGFELVNTTAPARWIINAKSWKRLPRSQYGRVLKAAKKRGGCEIDRLHASGMTVIYDCGQRIYRLSR